MANQMPRIATCSVPITPTERRSGGTLCLWGSPFYVYNGAPFLYVSVVMCNISTNCLSCPSTFDCAAFKYGVNWMPSFRKRGETACIALYEVFVRGRCVGHLHQDKTQDRYLLRRSCGLNKATWFTNYSDVLKTLYSI